MMRPTSGYRVCGRPAVTSFKLAAWTRRKPLSDAGAKGSSCKAARQAATTAPPRQHSHCPRQSSMQSLPCPSSLPAALPMVGPSRLHWHSAPTRSGSGSPARGSKANAHPQCKERVVAAGAEDTGRHLLFGREFPDALTRGLRNRIVREWEGRDHLPPYRVVSDSEVPVIGQARFYGQEFPMKRFCGFPPTPEFTSDFEEMRLLAGESVGQTKRLMSAASIIDEMIGGGDQEATRIELTSPPCLDETSQGCRRGGEIRSEMGQEGYGPVRTKRSSTATHNLDKIDAGIGRPGT